jgi:hypothetical protein
VAKYLVKNIDWDTDDDTLAEEELPDNILINSEYLDIENDDDIDTIIDAVSEYLSDEYGFCHRGFDIERYYAQA